MIDQNIPHIKNNLYIANFVLTIYLFINVYIDIQTLTKMRIPCSCCNVQCNKNAINIFGVLSIKCIYIYIYIHERVNGWCSIAHKIFTFLDKVVFVTGLSSTCWLARLVYVSYSIYQRESPPSPVNLNCTNHKAINFWLFASRVFTSALWSIEDGSFA